MATYILVDSLNMFMRGKHAGNGKDIDMRIGMALHIMLSSVRKVWRDFNGDHVVFCLEGRSWRKDFYKPYKANRAVKAAQRTRREIEDDELFMEAYDDMISFVNDKTNCSVIRCPTAEADDLIATWIQTHPNDQHIIISTDSDFYQLLAPNVKIYNGTTEQTHTLEGVFDAKGKRVIDKKTKLPVLVPNPEYMLFEKCVRGDSTDNIFSAYPGVRTKGSKNKTGINEAFADRKHGGYNYNNFMLQRWTDHEGKEHRVRDDYERNRVLIDLTAQPDEVKQACIATVREAVNKPQVSQVGFHFMRFAGKWRLDRISQSPQEFAEILNRGITSVSMVEP